MHNKQPMVEMSGVGKSYGTHRVLQDFNLTVFPSEVVSLIGPSGSGKTTALRCINFLESYDEGTVRIKGQPVGYAVDARGVRRPQSRKELAQVRRPTTMVFQQFNLWPHMTALENVVAPLVLGRGMARDAAQRKARAVLERVGLGARTGSYPAKLSGGQQQRVGIARALSVDPEVMLLDEPTSALDPELVGEVLDVINELAAEGMTMAMVTHEMDFAYEVSSRIVFMEAGQIVETGSREILRAPATDRLKQFLTPRRRRLPAALDAA
ncbi:MAG TPA: amino acid ABC transporter ATP-binding protein [Pseudorhodoferax sp.]|jgi:polar amino acid transport system ATP-binding protein|nr:amino acid ABC transporter ATP-binding protein [Pseudorhodoferax sp.]